MDLSTANYQFAGFFSASTVGFMHFQDIVMAIILGFFGAVGAFIFKLIVERIKKGRNSRI